MLSASGQDPEGSIAKLAPTLYLLPRLYNVHTKDFANNAEAYDAFKNWVIAFRLESHQIRS